MYQYLVCKVPANEALWNRNCVRLYYCMYSVINTCLTRQLFVLKSVN